MASDLVRIHARKAAAARRWRKKNWEKMKAFIYSWRTRNRKLFREIQNKAGKKYYWKKKYEVKEKLHG